MEAIKKRNIKPGLEYDPLFPKAESKVYTVKKNATLADTVAFIPKVVRETLEQTKQIAQRLKGSTVYSSCNNIWHFVYGHIQYKKDAKGYEQIRSPRRTWHDRTAGVDCDCYSVFISSILTNLGIPHILRITKYRTDNFQHIYPVVPFSGNNITLDCVTDRFDYEVPYSAKKDYPMDLQFLDGVPALYSDANDLYRMQNNNGLIALGQVLQGNLNKRNKKMGQKNPAMLQRLKVQATAPKNMPMKKNRGFLQRVKTQLPAPLLPVAPANSQVALPATSKKKKKGIFRKIGNVAKKALNVVNKINPATVLLRNGLLAAMKLNIMRVAQRLRWGYLNHQQAANANIDPNKFERLKKVIEKLEKIFYGAGGKPANLKKAILSGKGNKDKKLPLNGLEGLGAFTTDAMDVYTPLPQLLGPDIYYSENIEGFNGVDALQGLGELGEPISAAAITAAMGAVTAIAASLKQIGNIFKGKGQGAEDFEEATNAAAENNQEVPGTTPVPPELLPAAQPFNPVTNYAEADATTATNNTTSSNTARAISPATATELAPAAADSSMATEETIPNNAASVTKGNAANPDAPPNFWEKNKQWIKPVGIGVGILTIGIIGYQLFTNKHTKNKASPGGLSGLPKSRKNYRRKSYKKHRHLSAVPLK